MIHKVALLVLLILSGFALLVAHVLTKFWFLSDLLDSGTRIGVGSMMLPDFSLLFALLVILVGSAASVLLPTRQDPARAILVWRRICAFVSIGISAIALVLIFEQIVLDNADSSVHDTQMIFIQAAVLASTLLMGATGFFLARSSVAPKSSDQK